MTIGILCEKPSAAKHFAAALGGMRGTYQGTDYVIGSARGHLYEFVQPDAMVAGDLREKYRLWNLANLPWDLDDFDWKLGLIEGAQSTAQTLKSTLSGCEEIVIATDLDPTGEGGMIAVNAITQLHIAPARFSRMYFTDESAKSIQSAFVSRKPIPDLMQFDEYKKALHRSKWDFASMQWTRIATAMSRESGVQAVLRQGRLKSAMVLLVGDQLKAHNDYVKKPFFQNRFRDEHEVVYTNPDEPRFDAKTSVPASYTDSPVVRDSAQSKTTAPPKLLDLAGLSSLLVGKNIKAKTVLETYQKMYVDQVVSYPRTEDKTITHEQFKELLPLVDKIAAVVGVDPGLLVHRQPRSTHVKDAGAHGANRPGPRVPTSLDALGTRYGAAAPLIYEALAKNYLAMLADDYRYEQQKGHLEKYPTFVGIANVPQSAGWKAVFDPDAEDKTSTASSGSTASTGGKTTGASDDEPADVAAGLGSMASPFVFEGANKRPEHPSMKWLMKQLEKRDVGTGATRTSTYSEVTSASTKYPLLKETGRKLTLAEFGELSWLLLPGTHIADLSLTERIYAEMRDVAAGTAVSEQLLAQVADWVRDDLATMAKNADAMRSTKGLSKVVLKPKATGLYAPTGASVSFTKVWSGHEFTDAEIAKLLAGETISFQATSAKDGSPWQVTGALGESEYKGRRVFGFQREVASTPTQWSGHTFTADEVSKLVAGEKVFVEGFISSKTGNTFDTTVRWDAAKGKIEPIFDAPQAQPPKAWCGHTFTDAERQQLAEGKPIRVTGLKSKKGNAFDAELTWEVEKGSKSSGKKIVPTFG